MAKNKKPDNDFQVFRGSKPDPYSDPYLRHIGEDCCEPALTIAYDRLDPIVRFDNGLKHLNPAGANDKFWFPLKEASYKDEIIDFINQVGVGAKLGVLAVPNFADIRSIGVLTLKGEEGFTFDVSLRDGRPLKLKAAWAQKKSKDSPCGFSFEEVDKPVHGTLEDDVFAQYALYEIDTAGGGGKEPTPGAMSIQAESDEVIIKVTGLAKKEDRSFVGSAEFAVTINYDIPFRAERGHTMPDAPPGIRVP